ncbi:MAG: LPS export ABC transporter periplasmic protein LptC [Cyanobacteria bacterium RUI128]|nr:LPS export ABC transporter periplasmic protein LptC [Cyanobacteria bacterium RUI128]
MEIIDKFVQNLLSKANVYWEKAKKRWEKMSKRERTYFVVAVIIVMILMWAFITAGIITTNFNRNALRSGVDRQELQVSSMILTETKDGQKFWEIFGETGKYNSDHKIANLNNVVGNFYKDNQVEMSFEASKGIYNEETQEIILYENVFVVLKDDTSLKADKITYEIKTKVLNVEGNVIINKKHSFMATAEKAVIDSEYSRFRIIGHTSSKVYD